MRPPFPGMDPWLEHPDIWPDVHNSLIAAIRDDIAPRVAPRYYVSLETRTYLVLPDEDEAVVMRPDPAITPLRPSSESVLPSAPKPTGVLELDVEIKTRRKERVHHWFLEVRGAGAKGRLVTIIEVLSPANKLHHHGREQYERKRERVLRSRTNLVEIDLLRAGVPLPLRRPVPPSDYRILISRQNDRPKARLLTFSVRQPIPVVSIPLLKEDPDVPLDLGAVLHGLYDRARFDPRLDYQGRPEPPLMESDTAWAQGFLG